MAVGWRQKRRDALFARVIPSRAANWLIGKVSGISIKDNGCGIKAYRALVLEDLPLYSDMHRLLPSIVSMAGAKIAQVPVRHHARRFGQSKYGISRIYKVILDVLSLKVILNGYRHPLFGFGLLLI